MHCMLKTAQNHRDRARAADDGIGYKFYFNLSWILVKMQNAEYLWLAVLEIAEQYDRASSEADEIASDRAEAYGERGSRLNS